MFEGLAAEIEAVEIPVHGDAIAEARTLLDRLESRIVEADATYVRECSFELDGSAVSDALLSMVSSGGVLERLLAVDGRILDQGRSIRTFRSPEEKAEHQEARRLIEQRWAQAHRAA